MVNILKLPEALEQRLCAELHPDEILIWAGQPNLKRMMKDSVWAAAIFLLCAAFGVFCLSKLSWTITGYLPTSTNWGPLLFGLPLLAIGIWGLRGCVQLHRGVLRTVYALTSKRMLSIESATTIKVRSIAISDIADVVRVQYQDGTGDLVLRKITNKDSDDQRRESEFCAFNDVRQVEKLVIGVCWQHKL